MPVDGGYLTYYRAGKLYLSRNLHLYLAKQELKDAYYLRALAIAQKFFRHWARRSPITKALMFLETLRSVPLARGVYRWEHFLQLLLYQSLCKGI